MNLFEAHRAIAHLCIWTSGNVSERYGDSMMIKPSGVSCAEYERDALVRLSDGRHNMVPKPSTDSDAHRYIYNNAPEVNAIVHSHSDYATAMACRGQGIYCISTEQADTFGGYIPCAPYSEIGTDAIGRSFLASVPSPYIGACLLSNHGVLTTGRTVSEAVRNAIMVEHCAKIAILAGDVPTLSLDQIKANYNRYQTSYGQK